MVAYIFSEKQYESLMEGLKSLEEKLDKKEKPENEMIDNPTFLKEMKISRGTAQRWRDEGRIRFSKIGRKIFYNREDIRRFLEEYKEDIF